MAGMLVTTAEEAAGALVVYEKSNVSTTRQSISLGIPANAVEISAIDMGSSSAKLIYIVLNAVNDAAADAALATAGSRIPLPLGKTFRQLVASGQSQITRIDLKSNVAETGANLVVTFAKV